MLNKQHGSWFELNMVQFKKIGDEISIIKKKSATQNPVEMSPKRKTKRKS